MVSAASNDLLRYCVRCKCWPLHCECVYPALAPLPDTYKTCMWSCPVVDLTACLKPSLRTHTDQLVNHKQGHSSGDKLPVRFSHIVEIYHVDSTDEVEPSNDTNVCSIGDGGCIMFPVYVGCSKDALSLSPRFIHEDELFADYTVDLAKPWIHGNGNGFEVSNDVDKVRACLCAKRLHVQLPCL